MANITVDEAKCEGCGVCVDSCPVSIFSLEGGNAKVTGNVEECVVCKTCEDSCPTQTITVEE